MKNNPKPLAVYRRLYQHFGPQHWWPAETPFEVIVGAILTQQTTWKNVEKAIVELRRTKLLTPRKLHRVPMLRLQKIIRSSGYFRQKTQKLKSFLAFLFDQYQGNLQKWFRRPTGIIRQELLSIHGIGPETADSILLYAAQKPVFVVDAYTIRIGQRLGLFKMRAYAEVQHFFVQHIPRELKVYNEFHALLVALGKDYCRSKPLCTQCPLEAICPKVGVSQLSLTTKPSSAK